MFLSSQSRFLLFNQSSNFDLEKVFLDIKNVYTMKKEFRMLASIPNRTSGLFHAIITNFIVESRETF
jgi:hypothetical protein